MSAGPDRLMSGLRTRSLWGRRRPDTDGGTGLSSYTSPVAERWYRLAVYVCSSLSRQVDLAIVGSLDIEGLDHVLHQRLSEAELASLPRRVEDIHEEQRGAGKLVLDLQEMLLPPRLKFDPECPVTWGVAAAQMVVSGSPSRDGERRNADQVAAALRDWNSHLVATVDAWTLTVVSASPEILPSEALLDLEDALYMLAGADDWEEASLMIFRAWFDHPPTLAELADPEFMNFDEVAAE